MLVPPFFAMLCLRQCFQSCIFAGDGILHPARSKVGPVGHYSERFSGAHCQTVAIGDLQCAQHHEALCDLHPHVCSGLVGSLGAVH